MHFCPRDSCQVAWHRKCLLSHPIMKRPICANRKLSLMCSIPSDFLNPAASSSASATSPPSLLSLLSKPQSALTQSPSKTRKRKRDFEDGALSLLENLPQDLVELASQPIVKPTIEFAKVYEEPPIGRKGWAKAKGPREPENVIHNIAGNIATVLKARVLINDVIRGATILPRDWKKKIGWNDNAKSGIIVDSGEDSLCSPLLCPTCGEHI